MRILLALLACACAPPKPDVEPRPVKGPRSLLPDTPDTELPAAAPIAPWHLACEGDAAIAPTRRVVFQLPAIMLAPVRTGPRMTERPRDGKPRSALQIEDVIERAEPMLRGCWKWASARGAADTTLDVAFTMSPFGTISGLSITSPQHSAELVACLEETLPQVAIADLSPRTTRMRTKIAFVRAEQGKWPVPPRRPKIARPPARTKTCVPVLDNAATDQLASPIVYTVDDFDLSRVVRSPREPTVVIDCLRTGHVFTRKQDVTTAIEANLGALQACYADARDRDHAFTGRVDLVLEMAEGTVPTKVLVKGDGDAAFHACLTAAANDVWISEARPEGTLEAHVTFVLADTAPVDHVAALAIDRLALAAATTDRERCTVRARIVDTFAHIAPWLDDRRVLIATRALADLASTLPDAQAKTCLRPVHDLLHRIAFGGTTIDQRHLRWSWVDRLEAVMPIKHHLDGQLDWFHSASLAAWPPRHAEGVAKLRVIAANEGNGFINGLADAELLRYAQPRVVVGRAECTRH